MIISSAELVWFPNSYTVHALELGNQTSAEPYHSIKKYYGLIQRYLWTLLRQRSRYIIYLLLAKTIPRSRYIYLNLDYTMFCSFVCIYRLLSYVIKIRKIIDLQGLCYRLTSKPKTYRPLIETAKISVLLSAP